MTAFTNSSKFYSSSYKPQHYYEELPNDHRILRFDEPYHAMYYDYKDIFKMQINNIKSMSGIDLLEYSHIPTQTHFKNQKWIEGEDNHCNLVKYEKDRFILTKEKQAILDEIERDLKFDSEFLELVHNAKSEKRKYVRNKFCGNLSVVDFAKNDEKMFHKQNPGAKKKTLNILFQVGVFRGHNYKDSFKKILKTILMCQSMGINCNIDVCDAEYDGLQGNITYTIVNVAKSVEKISFPKLFCFYHYEFFVYTLFNSYLAAGLPYQISRFVELKHFKEDLGDRYDIIGGNMLNHEVRSDQMINQILKIASR